MVLPGVVLTPHETIISTMGSSKINLAGFIFFSFVVLFDDNIDGNFKRRAIQRQHLLACGIV